MFPFRGYKGRGGEVGEEEFSEEEDEGGMGRLSQEEEVGYEERGGVGGCCGSSVRCCGKVTRDTTRWKRLPGGEGGGSGGGGQIMGSAGTDIGGGRGGTGVRR